jgi:hypothetical protein
MTRRRTSISIDEVMELGPCRDRYPRSRVEQLFGGRQRVSALQILDEARICCCDKLWLLHRMGFDVLQFRKVAETAMFDVGGRFIPPYSERKATLEKLRVQIEQAA